MENETCINDLTHISRNVNHTYTQILCYIYMYVFQLYIYICFISGMLQNSDRNKLS